MANEKVNYKLDLDDGTYILIFHDSYGDGGVNGNIKFLKSGKELSKFSFGSGNRKTVEFNVRKIDDVKIINEKKEIVFDITCDYYGPQESKWNIIDSLDRTIFDSDQEFSNSNTRETIKTMLFLVNIK